MEHFDRHDDLALRRLDDLALEELRVQMVNDGDACLEIVIRELVLRAVGVIESICRTRGIGRSLSHEQTLKAVDDASVRLLLRLKRPDRQPAVTAVAAAIAAACVDAQRHEAPAPSRLVPRRPRLPVDEQLGNALKRGRLRRNNWRTS